MQMKNFRIYDDNQKRIQEDRRSICRTLSSIREREKIFKEKFYFMLSILENLQIRAKEKNPPKFSHESWIKEIRLNDVIQAIDEIRDPISQEERGLLKNLIIEISDFYYYEYFLSSFHDESQPYLQKIIDNVLSQVLGGPEKVSKGIIQQKKTHCQKNIYAMANLSPERITIHPGFKFELNEGFLVSDHFKDEISNLMRKENISSHYSLHKKWNYNQTIEDLTSEEFLHFSISGPRSVVCDCSFIINIWAHLEEQRIEILRREKETLPERPIQLKSIGPVKVETGTTITFFLELDGFNIENHYESIYWNGDLSCVNFLVHVPETIKAGEKIGTVKISANGLTIARLHFNLLVQQEPITLKTESIPSSVNLIKSAFVSYSSKDKDLVYPRIHGMQKIAPYLEFKMDVKDLRSGSNWKNELRKLIENCDTFYLFWSKNAKESEWVEKEWRCAYNLKGIDFIDPVPLESPDDVPPPQELSDKHFNDWVLAFTRNHRN
jgi:hypothetical protein